MKNIMKLIGVAAVALAAVILTPSAHAQNGAPSYGWQSFFTSPTYFTNGVGTNFTIANMPVLDVRKSRNVAMSFSFVESANDISNSTIVFIKSVDGVNWDTNAGEYISMTIPGPTALQKDTFVTNLDVQGFGYLGMYSFTNSTLHSYTNLGAAYSVKLSAP